MRECERERERGGPCMCVYACVMCLSLGTLVGWQWFKATTNLIKPTLHKLLMHALNSNYAALHTSVYVKPSLRSFRAEPWSVYLYMSVYHVCCVCPFVYTSYSETFWW